MMYMYPVQALICATNKYRIKSDVSVRMLQQGASSCLLKQQSPRSVAANLIAGGKDFMNKYKVIIWGLGHVGTAALEHLTHKDSVEVVGVYDVDPEKVGKDAGEIAGIGPVGVTVTDDREGLLNKDADVVLYYSPQRYEGTNFDHPYMLNYADIVELLNSKKNVITTATMYHSDKLAPEWFEKIDAAGKANGVTYVQQGIFPGLFIPYLPVVLAMGVRDVKKVEVYGGEPDELNFAPWAAGLSYGKSPEEFNPAALNFFLYGYGGSTIVIADRLGLDYDEYYQTVETVLSDRDYDTKNPMFGVVKEGTVGAQILHMGVKKDGEEVVGFHFVHKASREILPDLSLDFKIEVQGENKMSAVIDGILPEDVDVFLTSETPNVNQIASLVAAEPGYLDALDLPVFKTF